MITKTHSTLNGISYWTTLGDDEDNLLYAIASRPDTYRDSITGGAGNDTLLGSGGDDTLNGGDGNDKLDGGGDQDILNGDSGNDTLYGSGGNDTLNGGAGNDLVAGGDDDDLLLQQDWLGADTFDGGRGTDTLDYSAAAAGAAVHVSLASRTVVKYLDGVASATDSIRNVDRFIVTASNDTLEGNSGNNLLEGLGGNDQLNGGDGDDSLNGDYGANFLPLHDPTGGDDTLNGGAGIDSLFGGDGNDLFVQDRASGGDKIDGGTGIDTVDYSQLDTAGILVNLATGKVNKYAYGYLRAIDTLRNIEQLIATDLNDTLNGGGGYVSLAGGAGNDRFAMLIAAGDTTLDGGRGFDTLDYGSATSGAAIALDLQAGTVSKFLNGQLIGVDTVGNFELFNGSDGADTFTGSASAEVINGGAGNDLFLQNFQTGSDTFDGGLGADTVAYRLASDGAAVNASLATGVVIKYQHDAAVGTETLRNIENLIGTGGNDTLAGGAGDNSIDGGAGDDRIVQDSARGNDAFNGGAGSDTLDYSQLKSGGVAANFATGTVDKYTGSLLSASDNFRDIEFFIGTASNDTLMGGQESVVLDGQAGDDRLLATNPNATLLGGAGNDTLKCYADHDSLSGGEGDDLMPQDWLTSAVTFDGGAGIDTVDYSHLTSYFAGGSVEVDLADGSAKTRIDGASLGFNLMRNIEIVIGTGNADALTGSRENEGLRGGAGNDSLNGGGGNDQISVDEGDDFIVQSNLAGNATIDGGGGIDTLDYRQIRAAGGSVEIDWATGIANKYSADHVLRGIDTFTGCETILLVLPIGVPVVVPPALNA